MTMFNLKAKFSFFMAVPFLFFILTISSSAFQKEKDNYLNDVYQRSLELINKSSYEQAKMILLDAVATRKPQKSPFVENGTLHFYGQNSSQTLLSLMSAVAFSSSKNENDTSKVSMETMKDLQEIYDKTPWTNSVVIAPDYPNLYLMLGVIAINEKKYDQAIKYIDTSLYIWETNGIAWSEMIYIYMTNGNIEKAKEIGKKALAVKNLSFDKEGYAGILRKMGYIAIEENELDTAEDYYKRSLEYQEHEVARQELELIKQIREKKK